MSKAEEILFKDTSEEGFDEYLFDMASGANAKDFIIKKMKKYAKWYAKKCLKEADTYFEWDHDFEQWGGDYKPSEIDLPSHD